MIAPKPLNRIPTILCLCLITHVAFAQGKANNTWGKITAADFAGRSLSPLVDSNTSAIILSDIGSVHFVGNRKGWFSWVYKRQTRIKVLRKNGFDLDKVVIGLHAGDEDPDKLSNVEAITYNLENGNVIETKLDQKDIFQDRKSKSWTETKFSLPGIKEGAILEYTYTVTSDWDLELPTWEFQREKYPCLWSEYQVEIPQALYYIVVRQGTHPYLVDKGSEGNANYRVVQKSDRTESLVSQDQSVYVSARTVKHDWVLKEIPAFGREPYLTAPENYMDKLSFQLSKTYNGAEFHDVLNSWANLTDMLLRRDDFGLPLDADDDWLMRKVEEITAGKNEALDEAKSIYYYLTAHLTCTNHDFPWIRTTFSDVLKKNSGTVGDINLLLAAMLRRKGLHADPVLLSTRDNGFSLATYPVMNRLNYVIVRMKLADKTYYLDAAYPQLGFGQLPGNCYNGHARVISNTDSGSVWFWADSLRETRSTMVRLTNTDKGIEGNLQTILGKDESYQLRRTIAESGKENYFKQIQASLGEDITISNGGLDSLDRPEDPVKRHYDISMKGVAGAPIIYLNPVMGTGWRENPLEAADRNYPVEMPYSMDDVYTLSMDVPPGYVVDELPKSAKVAFNGDQGSFEYLVAQSGDMIQLRCRVRLNKANFQPEDYAPLREFFGFIVKKENEQIVLKKK